MTTNQTSSIAEAVQNAKNSNMFKNLSRDLKALIKDPEAFFREIYHLPRLPESLVLVGAAVVLTTVMTLAATWSIRTGLQLNLGSRLVSSVDIFLQSAIEILLLFGVVFATQLGFTTKFKTFSPDDVKKALTVFAYGLIPFILILPITSILHFVSLHSLAVLTTAAEDLSLLLIGLGIMCQKDEPIHMRRYLIITTIIIIGSKIGYYYL